jgi:serine/threonine protein kinase
MSETSLLSPQAVIQNTYEVERLLGKGGMGEVWLARHLRLSGKHVAIKVLRAMGPMQGEALSRFKREAEIAAKLEHPNIVQVSDFNTLPSGEPFLVMEYLKGESLAARLKRGLPALAEVFHILRQVGAALQVAHQGGVVHRDLKPENIFLVPSGNGDLVKVLDFGISKLADSSSILTSDSMLIGTPLYMSPEQALGQNRDMTPQSDLFSLGSIAFEMLTGAAPFVAESIAKVIFKVAYEKAPALSQTRQDLPAHVVSAVERSLVKEREGRTLTIEAFVFELTGSSLTGSHAQPALPATASQALTESMLGGATLASSSPGKAKSVAEPVKAVSQISALPQKERAMSGKKLAIALVSVCVSGALGVIVMRREWAKMPSTVDAGPDSIYLGSPEVPFVPTVLTTRDAGEAFDSGAQNGAAFDAGGSLSAVLDGGRTKDGIERLPTPKTPMTPEEELFLKELAGWNSEMVLGKRGTIRAQLKTPSAKAQGLTRLLQAHCEHGDIIQNSVVLRELKVLVGPTGMKRPKAACLKVYPSASALEW